MCKRNLFIHFSSSLHKKLCFIFQALANGKIVVALEGGYNLNSISYSMTMVTKALLGDPLPALAPYEKPMTSAIESVRSTMKYLVPYWSCLKFGLKRLPGNYFFKIYRVFKID